MTEILDWNANRDMWIRVLHQQSGEGLAYWNKRVAAQDLADAEALRAWLRPQGVTGYGATVLVMERFGYPDWASASAYELLENQYADRAQLRPIYDAIIEAVSDMGVFTIQMRKTYVSLLTGRRTFARIRPSTKTRVDLGLRLEGQEVIGRLRPCKLQETMKVMLSFNSAEEVDAEAIEWLRRAFDENS